MIEKIFLRRSLLILLVISALFALLSSYSIRFQFSVWELFIDAKIVTAAVFFFAAWKKQWIVIAPEHFPFLRFDWRSNTALFFAPVLFYLFPIAAGFTSKNVSLNPLENAATLVLGTLFDIPALFVFSATSVFIEEVMFRGILFRSLRENISVPMALVLTNVVWMLFCLSEIFSVPDITILKSLVIGFFFFSIGLFCSALTAKYNSIWQGYSFRVGIIALTPILLTSFLAESDSFFTTESILFAADGVLVSLLLCMVAAYFIRHLPVSDQITGK
jgi:membrane protease YdiL (CAAX protease family)